MRNKINVMVGTSPKGQGGIASVIRGYQSLGLFAQHNITLVVTHHSGYKNPLMMGYIYLQGLLHFLWLGLTHQIQWVHIHVSKKGSYHLKKWIARLARRFGAKVMLHLHSGGFVDFYQGQTPSQQQQIVSFFSNADAVIALSKQSANWINAITHGQQTPQILYNTVPTLQLDLTQRQPQRVLFLGNLTQAKGVYDLVDVFLRLIKDFPQAQLRLGGTGDNESIQAIIDTQGANQNIQLLGWVDGEKKQEEIQRATIFCLPSYHEQMPMSLLEAMSAQMAVVTTQVGGIPDIIHPDKNGLLTAPAHQGALYSALYRLFSHENGNKTLAHQAQKDFKLHFCEPVMQRQLSQLYQSLEMDS